MCPAPPFPRVKEQSFGGITRDGCISARQDRAGPVITRPRGKRVVALVSTVAYLGLDARAVEVQCQIAPGMPRFSVVGLPDKAVGESRERVHAALAAMGLSLPPKRITINLSPADLPKEGV